MQKLTLTDIKDLREYERERESFRSHIIELKQRRRVQLGELITIVFENFETMLFQVQEMARAERIMEDAQLEHEVTTYNQLIPDEGELSGTLFIEINDKPRLYEWLPKLVGIQHAVFFELGDPDRVPSIPQDEERLTREEVTTTVHYLKFSFTPRQAEALKKGPAAIVVDHANYKARTDLNDAQRAALAADLA